MRCLKMAHHVVPTLVQASRPSITGGGPSARPSSPNAEEMMETDFVACKSRVQRGVLCLSFFVMQLVIVVNVKDTITLCRILIGFSSLLVLIQLIRYFLSIFCARHPLHDPFIPRRHIAPIRFYPGELASSPPAQMTRTGVATILPHVSPSFQSLHNHALLMEPLCRREAPPPYHLALTLPQPREYVLEVPEVETPPPEYEKVLPA